MNNQKNNSGLKSKARQILNEYALDVLIGFMLATFFVIMMSFSAHAQNVGINNPTPHSKSLLDLTSSDKGLLTPRMTQIQRLAMFPVTDATAKGMLVYQTDNVQGFYYYDGASWKIIDGGNNGWSITGNSGTNATTNFMGTNDSINVVFKSNSKEVMQITPSQKLGIGTNKPGSGYASAKVEIADETGGNSDFAMRTAGGGHPEIVLESSNGTLAAPTTSSSGAWGGVIIGQVYDGTQYTNTSAMIFGTEGINTVGNVAGTIQFNTNKPGPNGWEKMRLSSMGNLGVGVLSPTNRLDVAGNANVMLDSNYRINNIRVLSAKGNANFFAGLYAGTYNVSGGYNTFVGHLAGYYNTTGGSNAFFGQVSGVNNTTGNWNTFLGNNSGLHNTTGNSNVYVGSHSGLNGTIGSSNVFIGAGAGTNNNDSSNVFIGASSGYNSINGKNNSILGNASGYNCTGSNNSILGFGAGYSTSGNFNSFFGVWAGSNNTTGSNNSYFGNNARGAATISNAGAFGNNAYVALSNSIVLGDTGANIGINNSSPLYPLHFRSTLGDKIALWGGAGNHYGIGIQANLLQIHSGSAVDDIAFGTGSSNAFTEKMRVKGNGKVGIGTSTPGNLFSSALLEIADSSGTNKDVLIRSSNNSNYQQVLAFARTRGTYSVPTIVQNNDNIGRFTGMGYDGTALLTSAEIQFHIDSIPGLNSMPGNITFHTTPYNSGSVCAERMRIDRNGNVGINTNSPSARFHINGSFKITDGTQAAGKVLTSDAAGMATWQTLNAANVNAWGMSGNTGINAATNFIGTTDVNDLLFKTNNTTRMTIGASGNIGINAAPSPIAKMFISAPAEPGLIINGSYNYDGVSVYVNGTGFANNGIYAVNTGTGNAVFGKTGAASGPGDAVFGMAQSTTGTGVEGVATTNSGINYGIKGSTASTAGYSGYFSGGQFYVGSNAGFGSSAPQTKVEVNGSVSYIPDASLIANAAVFNITVGDRTYFRINSNAVPASRIISLSNGLQVGQVLMLECTATGGTNGIRLADTPASYNTNLATFHDMYENDVITLIWNGTDWLEVNFANN